MTALPSIPQSHSIPAYIEDGARIAAILLVWGVLAAFFTFAVGEIGGQGGIGGTIGRSLGTIFMATGFLNAVLYVLYRLADYWHEHE